MKLGITADRKPSLDAMWRAYRAAISGIEDESDWARVVTTTYGYDAFGARVYQIASTTATTTYPFKFFSVASSTRSGTNYSTTTEYVFNGYASRDRRSSLQEWSRNRQCPNALHPSRSPRLHQRRHQRERHSRSDTRLLPVWRDGSQLEHRRSELCAKVHWTIRRSVKFGLPECQIL